MKLTCLLSKLREKLGVDNPVVQAILVKESPEALAAKVIGKSTLNDAIVRKQLWEGGALKHVYEAEHLVKELKVK